LNNGKISESREASGFSFLRKIVRKRELKVGGLGAGLENGGNVGNRLFETTSISEDGALFWVSAGEAGGWQRRARRRPEPGFAYKAANA